MKTRSRALVGLAALGLAVSLAACSTPKDEPAGSSTDSAAAIDSSTPITLTVWESLNGPDKFIEEAGAAYTDLHPNITIEFQNVEVGDSPSQIALDGPAGTGPDVFAVPHDNLGALISAGHILDAEDHAAAIEENVVDVAINGATYDGALWGYPMAVETYALYYNKALVETPPTTWAELTTWATEFNAANQGKYGFIMDVGNAYYTIIFTAQPGNMLFGDDGTDAATPNLATDASVKGMGEFAKLRSALDVAAADLATATDDGLFAAGNAAMYISGPWNVANFTDQGVDFGVTTLPALDGQSEPASSFAGVRLMAVSAYSEHPAEAADFAEFLTTPEMQQLRVDLTGALAASSSDITYENDAAQGFIDQMETSFPMPSIPEMSKFWDAMNAASANIWNGADPKTELDAAQAAVLAES
ncbi:MAG: maltose ABC transporter substrate-binding protein [Propionibacteriaceae bacterium]|jgi:arabinogalactan oligomer/maltooligosaccharide transport system substrate-binding protein|nr:maltose ABC transporter substrate-binding protein [Propionibacteriaceae bacterium]